MALVDVRTDVLVCGGGMAGVCAAISAARHGANVLLVQDRSRLGGNASSEIRMHIVGADVHGHRSGWREGGLIEELRLEDAVHNSHRAYELWDLLLYDKCVSERNLTLLLDSSVYAAQVQDGRIEHAMVRCDKTEHLYRVRSHIYCDCTGDSRLALEAGAETRWGREAADEFGETLAVRQPDRRTQGSSILFTARKHDRPTAFKPPGWARKITDQDLKFRGIPNGAYEYGYWWIELGGIYDTIKDNERLRFELLSIVLGVWDWIKNGGKRPDSANWALQTVGMIPGKRESRRVMGDHIQTEQDLKGGWKTYPDGVAIGGWNFDDHPPEGFDAPAIAPFRGTFIETPYNIALGAAYSKSISNLMMAGRNISNTHVAFTSTRVMATCACIGQAVGTCAAMCSQRNLLPRQIRDNPRYLRELQQQLLRDDQSIRGVRNEDPADLALRAKVTASASIGPSRPEHVTGGEVRDMPSEWTHRWGGAMTREGAWLQLQWEQPETVRHVQLTFDSGFERELTLTAVDSFTARMVRGPQPETVRDYALLVRGGDGQWREIVRVEGNHQRLRRHEFKPVQTTALRLKVTATNGAKEARLYEIRCYA